MSGLRMSAPSDGSRSRRTNGQPAPYRGGVNSSAYMVSSNGSAVGDARCRMISIQVWTSPTAGSGKFRPVGS